MHIQLRELIGILTGWCSRLAGASSPPPFVGPVARARNAMLGKREHTPPCSSEELSLPKEMGAAEERCRWQIWFPWFLQVFCIHHWPGKVFFETRKVVQQIFFQWWSCALCSSLLCLECQRHTIWRSQLFAMRYTEICSSRGGLQTRADFQFSESGGSMNGPHLFTELPFL